VALATKREGEKNAPSRRLLPDELRVLMWNKCENPMLGIYAAHLLLLETQTDVPLFTEVVRNLRRLVRAPHPDVEALALRAAGEPPTAPFEYPPMLHRGWELIVEATVDRPYLVTPSLSARNTGVFWAEGPWHIWTTAAATRGLPEYDDELSDLETALAEDLGVLKHVRRAKSRSRRRRDQETAAPTGVTRGLPPSDLFPPAMSEETSATDPAAQSNVMVELEPTHLRSIAKRFGMPHGQLHDVLAGLENKLGRMAGVPAVKVVMKMPDETR